MSLLFEILYRIAVAFMVVFIPLALVLVTAAAWQTWQHLPELFR